MKVGHTVWQGPVNLEKNWYDAFCQEDGDQLDFIFDADPPHKLSSGKTGDILKLCISFTAVICHPACVEIERMRSFSFVDSFCTYISLMETI